MAFVGVENADEPTQVGDFRPKTANSLPMPTVGPAAGDRLTSEISI
jgi:hypothetical protein